MDKLERTRTTHAESYTKNERILFGIYLQKYMNGFFALWGKNSMSFVFQLETDTQGD